MHFDIIFAIFWSGGFTVAHFRPIFYLIFIIILLNFLPNLQKWAKNKIKNEQKMATVNN